MTKRRDGLTNNPSLLRLVERVDSALDELVALSSSSPPFSSTLEPTPVAHRRQQLPLSDLEDVDAATLRSKLSPAIAELESIDAADLLRLTRLPRGEKGDVAGAAARLDDGAWVAPIYNDIKPFQIQTRGHSCVRYLHITEVENRYSVGIFVFPPGATIPLHDHPGMCVLSRVLYGDLAVRSFDLVPDHDDSDYHDDEDDDHEESSGGTTLESCDMDQLDLSEVTNDKVRGATKTVDLRGDDPARVCEDDDRKRARSGSWLSPISSWIPTSFRVPAVRRISLHRQHSSSSTGDVTCESSVGARSGGGPTQSQRRRRRRRRRFPAPPDGMDEGRRRASLNPPRRIRAPGVSVLFPHEGNAHEFTAGESGAAVLDVLLPPYDHDGDRDCTFYRSEADRSPMMESRVGVEDRLISHDCNKDYDDKAGNKRRYWLVPISQPASFRCLSGSYGHFGVREDEDL